MTKKNFIRIGSFMKLIVNISDNPDLSLHAICKKTNINYANSHGIILWAEIGGLLTRKRIGREIRMTLTENGLRMAESCRTIINIVNQVEVHNEKNNVVQNFRRP